MLTSSFLNYRIITALVISVLFGLVMTSLLPLFNKHPQLMLALPAVGVFFLMLVVNPRATFVLVFLTRPMLDVALNLTKVSFGGQEIGFGAILNLIVIALAVFLFFYEGVFPRKNPVVHAWVFFLVVMMIAVVESPYGGRAIRLYANFLSYFAMFLIPFLIIKTREDFIFWVKIFAWSFVLPVFYANIDLLQGGQFYADAGTRIKGSFSHPNVLAFYLCLGLTYYFYLLKSKLLTFSPRVVLAMVMLMLNMVVLLLATKTRNAWIGCFGIFFIYGLLKDRKALLILFCLLPLLMFVPSVKDRVVTLSNGKSSINYKGINSYEWRVRMWKSSIPRILQRPLQGYGLASFYPMSREFSDVGSNGAHNLYVETLFESGVLGLMGLLGLFFAPLITFIKNMKQAGSKQHSALYAIVVAYLSSYILICGADNLGYYLAFNWYVWFFISLMYISKQYISAPVKPGNPTQS